MEDFTEVFAWGSDHFGQLGLGSKQHKTYTMPKFCSFNILIKSISCGDQHSGFISSQGCVYTMGSNLEGRLGISDQSVRFSASPCLVESLRGENCKKISCGGGHSLVVTEDGTLFSWGFGDSGALGLGTLQTQWSPVAVKLPLSFRAIEASCGSKHSSILARSREVGFHILMTGTNDSGQLGTGKREKEVAFTQIRLPEEPLQVSCGIFHSGFLTISGKVYTTGGNAFGQLGLGNKKGTCIPRKVEALDSHRIRQISCSSHSAALSENGEVFVWGTGIFGEYVLPHKVMNRGKEIAVGGNFTLVLDEQDNLFTWGNNLNGELGIGDFDARNSPAQVSSLQGKKVRVMACGSNFVLALGDDIKYQSSKHKSTTPLRQAGKEAEYSVTLHESPKMNTVDQGQYRNSRVLNKKNVYEPLNYERPVIENKRPVDDRRDFELYIKEFEKFKDENFKVLAQLEKEQKKCKMLEVENEELRRMNEMLRVHESKMHQESLLVQNQMLDIQRVRMMLEESKHNSASLEVQNQSLREEVMRMENLVKSQEREFNEQLRNKLVAQENDFINAQHRARSDFEAELEAYDQQIKELESNLSLTTSQKNRLEDALSISSSQISDLENQLSSYEIHIKQTESLLSQATTQKHNLEKIISENSIQMSDLSNKLQRSQQDLQNLKVDLSSKLQRSDQDIQNLKNDLSHTSSQKDSIENSLHSANMHNSELLEKLAIYESELKRMDSEISNLNAQKNKLEDQNIGAHNQNLDLSAQMNQLKAVQSSLESSKLELLRNLENMSRENNELKQETIEKEAQRDYMVKLIEDKMQELENDRCMLVSERDNLNRAVNDLTFEISRLNQNLTENNKCMIDLENQLAEEISKTSRLMIDLETAKEEIVILELKNTEIFENLQRELSQRAKDYKDRTLTLLNTPSRNLGRSSLADQSVVYNYSPTRETGRSPESIVRSPVKETVVRESRSPLKDGFGYSTMPSINLIGQTPGRVLPGRNSSLSRSQQERINAAAMKLLRNTESPLRSIRVSSPSRRSPNRPSPYRSYF